MSSKLLSILVLVAAVCVLSLITMQVLELTHYSAAPTVWAH